MNGYRILGIGYWAATLLFCVALLPHGVRSQAIVPEKGYFVLSYNATVKLDRQTDSLFGEVTMTGRADTVLFGVLQHAKYLTLDSVFIDGARTTAVVQDSISGSYIVSVIDQGIPRGQEFKVHTYYHGKGMTEQSGPMHWGGVTDSDTMMFAMGVGFGASYTGCTRHWLPCYDLPDNKPDSVDLTFICRSGDVTASNGLLVSNTVSNGWRTMHWHVSHPIASYLLMFATGPYTKQNIANSLGIPFEVYALQRDSVEAAIQMNVRVRQILSFYDTLFGHYPFEKVGYVVTPIGSMEHQTMICLDKHVLVGDSAAMSADTSGNSTVAVHELAHMWWGDRVTCQTFDDAWLNEGFACYCESLVLEHLFGWEKYLTRQQSNIASAKSGNLPLFGASTANKHSNNYPSLIYQKGSAVLGMLRQYLGDSVFFACVRYYGNAHAYSTATSIDLQTDFELTSGHQDLNWFFKEWVFGTRYPKDTVTWTPYGKGVQIEFHQVMNAKGASPQYFRVPIPVEGHTASGLTKRVTVWMDSVQSSTAFADFGFTPDSIVFDPDGLIIMRIIPDAKLAVAPSSADPRRASALRVFPNPSHASGLMFEMKFAKPTHRCSVAIYDTGGKAVRTAEFNVSEAVFSGKMDLSGIPNGSYRVEVTGEGNQSGSAPFVLQQ